MQRRDLELTTGQRVIHDVTAEVRDFARACGGSGLLHLFLPHATAGLALLETGAGSDDDLVDALERLLPRDDRYRHRHGSSGHGADHVLPALISPALTLAVDDGHVVLGTWQSVVVVDPNVDNPDRTLQLRYLPA